MGLHPTANFFSFLGLGVHSAWRRDTCTSKQPEGRGADGTHEPRSGVWPASPSHWGGGPAPLGWPQSAGTAHTDHGALQSPWMRFVPLA